MSKDILVPYVLHGGDYNPDQWIDCKQIWDEDMRLMKQAHINTMTVGVFSWATLEPSENEYDFSFLDEIIDKIDKNGGKVILATPSGARPRWLAEKYPEVLRVNKNETRDHYHERHNHCFTSPIYRQKVAQIDEALAKRYGNHKAVIAWHVSNEYGGECYCDLCKKAFQDYLKEKYQTVENMNKAYWATFWSHQYTSFSQVEIPVISDVTLKALLVDWRRFVTKQTIEFMNVEISALRKYSDLPTTINMMGEFNDLDYFKFGEHIDYVSWDNYPEWHSPNHLHEAIKSAFWNDLFRSIKHKPFLLMESAPGQINWRAVNKLKRPGMDKLASMQSVAHGSNSVMYFQFRKSRGASEKFHGAVVDHVGTSETRVFNVVKDICITLEKISDVVTTYPQKARVAIVYDWENKWALDFAQGFKIPHNYNHDIYKYYSVLWQKGVACDVVNEDSDISSYDLVIAPMVYMAKQDFVNKLVSYVENGGTLYATYMLSTVNETDLCYLNGIPANELKNVFGVLYEETDSLYDEDLVKINYQGKEFCAKDICERIHAGNATVLATYGSEFYKGEPAFTVNCYKQGRAYYQAFRDDGEFSACAISKILQDLSISGAIINATLPTGVTAHVRQSDKIKYLFVENYSDSAVTVNLDGVYTNVDTSTQDDVAQLNPFEVKIYKQVK